MELTKSEKDILLEALCRLGEFYDGQEATVRQFKHICEVPMSGKEYEENKNIFEFQDKAISEILKKKKEASDLIIKLVNK